MELLVDLMEGKEWETLVLEIAKIEDFADAMALSDCLSSQAGEAVVLAETMDGALAEATETKVDQTSNVPTTEVTGVARVIEEDSKVNSEESCLNLPIPSQHVCVTSGPAQAAVSATEVSPSKESSADTVFEGNSSKDNAAESLGLENLFDDTTNVDNSVSMEEETTVGSLSRKEKQLESKLRRQLKALTSQSKRKTWKECQQLLNEKACTPACPCMCEEYSRQRRKEQAAQMEARRNRGSAFAYPNGKADYDPEIGGETKLGNDCPIHTILWQRLFKRAVEKGWSTNLEEYVKRQDATENGEGPRLPEPNSRSTGLTADKPQVSSVCGSGKVPLAPEAVANATGALEQCHCDFHNSSAHSTRACRALRLFRERLKVGSDAPDEGIIRLYDRLFPLSSREGKRRLVKQSGLSAQLKLERMQRWKGLLLKTANVAWYPKVHTEEPVPRRTMAGPRTAAPNPQWSATNSWTTRNNGLGLTPSVEICWRNPVQAPWQEMEERVTLCPPSNQGEVVKFKYSGIVVESPVPYVKEFEHEVTILGGPTYPTTSARAMEDSGAGRSFVSLDLVEKLGLCAGASTTRVELADGNVVDSIGKIELTFQFVCYRVRYCFDIMAIPDYDMVIGRDLLMRLGLHPAATIPVGPPPDARLSGTEKDREDEDDSGCTPEEVERREKLLPTIHAWTKTNQDQVPPTAVCNHPQATIRIEHDPSTKPAYMPQFKQKPMRETMISRHLVDWIKWGYAVPYDVKVHGAKHYKVPIFAVHQFDKSGRMIVVRPTF